MSMPNIPDIRPEITLKRKEAINLLLSSIALEEIGLSHIINAEGEKIQRFVKDHCVDLEDILRINRSVELMLRNVIKNQMLLQFKLEDVMLLDLKEHIDYDDDCYPEE
ncbi:hypothetical protein E6C60_0581 [Paenibacillus algicola]|uniref:Uncharacterized protein n=1 Tax=Paenibacillus algicola TaxID=2565926 RepID=A0A4V1G3I4_9BACL|nr:hypothetical protein [Paenibacillus algicola]QCT01304.1 hypothetical protein E6C60_0581 [Paenibacillus algicola]